jgi:RNA polymerase sigma-70 factor (ECF subfamily)
MTRRPDPVPPAPRPSDPLIAACRRGDGAALEQVFRAESPRLCRLIAKVLGPHADADDVLQNTLVVAMEAFPRFRGEASVQTWLSGIALNVIKAHLRRPERTRRVPLEALPDLADPAIPADTRTDARRRVERIYLHLDAIGPMQRIAFVLHVIEGLPIEEVASLVDASRAATKSRVFWARLRLMKQLRRDPLFQDLEGERP